MINSCVTVSQQLYMHMYMLSIMYSSYQHEWSINFMLLAIENDDLYHVEDCAWTYYETSLQGSLYSYRIMTEIVTSVHHNIQTPS